MVTEKEFREIIERTETLHLSDPQEEEQFLKENLTKNLTQPQYITLNLQLAYCFLVLSRYNDSYELYSQMKEFALKDKNEELYADTLEGIGNTQVEIGQKKEARKNLLEAISIYQKLNLPEKESKASNCLAVLYFQANDYDEAIKWYEKAQNLTDDKKSIRFVNALGNSGLIYHSQGNMEKAAEIYSRAVSIAKECHYSFVRLIFQEKLGETYRELGDLENAEANFNDAYQFAVKMQDDKHIGTLSTFLANFWLEMGNFHKAYTYLQQGFIHLKKVHFPFGLLDCYYVSAQFWLAKGQLADSKKDLFKVLEIIESNGIFEVECDVLTMLAEVHESLGELDEAFRCLVKADKLAQERNSKFQHAMVLLQRARININLTKFNEAIIFLNEVLWIAGESEDLYLVYESNFLFTQIYLTKYIRNKTTFSFYEEALKYLRIALRLTKEKKLIPRYINTLIIEALLTSSQNDYPSALNSLKTAQKYAEESRMDRKLQEINERLNFIENTSPSHKICTAQQNFVLAIALEDLRRFTFFYPNNSLTEKLTDDSFIVAYEIFKNGDHKILSVDNTPLVDISYSAEVDQMGRVYARNLYSKMKNRIDSMGPFPFGKRSTSSFLVKLLLETSSPTSELNLQKSICILAIVFPQKMNSLFYDKEKVEWLIYNRFNTIKTISQITPELLRDVRSYVMQTLIAELQKTVDEYHSADM
ncbi:tetratricopeptide repeat protein [Candidatus Lokiarchaeum ossiferum]|uniref:tetratricopeptide repeat protein n=1 Tax=Candidatus Lokiarchaeum ossiferum TaxID=2951803 RepID=UPI00352E5A97